MLDRDLAELYGVPTKRLNEQVKRNAERFPPTFMFPLSRNEMKELVAKEIYTKNSEKNTEIVIAKLGNDAGIIGAAFLGKAK